MANRQELPFVCRRCTSLPEFSNYQNLRAHLRVIHGQRNLPNSDLCMYEKYPGSRYQFDEFRFPAQQTDNRINPFSNRQNVPSSQMQTDAGNVTANAGNDRSNEPPTTDPLEKKIYTHLSCGLSALNRVLVEQQEAMVKTIASSVEDGMRKAMSEFFNRIENASTSKRTSISFTENVSTKPVVEKEDVATGSDGPSNGANPTENVVFKHISLTDGNDQTEEMVVEHISPADGIDQKDRIGETEPSKTVDHNADVGKEHVPDGSPTNSDRDLMNVSMDNEVSISQILKDLEEEVKIKFS